MFILCGCGSNKDSESLDDVVEKDYTSLTDKDFLVSIGSFEKIDSSNVIWSFLEDGKGFISLDGEKTKYEMTWKLKDNKLVVVVKWVYEEKKEYDITFDKENKKIILDDEYELIKTGTVKKTSLKGDKPTELIGAWSILEDNGNYMWYFNNDYCYVGYYVDKLYVIDKYSWGVVDGDLVLVSVSLKKEKYGYVVSDDNLVLYRKNEVINTFNRFAGDVIVNK